MGLATRHARELAGGVGVERYAGVAGEPALGPVASPHRLSAFPNPLAPITHHCRGNGPATSTSARSMGRTAVQRERDGVAAIPR